MTITESPDFQPFSPPSPTIEGGLRYWVEKGLEPIAHLLKDDSTTNIFMPRYDRIFVDGASGRSLVEGGYRSDSVFRNAIHSLARQTDQSFDERHPRLLTVLPDGSRLTAICPPLSPFTALTIRMFPKVRFTLDSLQSNGAFSVDCLALLRRLIDEGHNILVAGSTNSGKTTLLNAMCQHIPRDRYENILIVEDTPEISLVDWPMVTRMEVPDTLRHEGEGDFLADLGTLIETALRYSPDRIIVGEIRTGNAASAFYDALNTGHRGVCATIHANGTDDGIKRLSNLVSRSSTVPYNDILDDLRGFIDCVVFVHKNPITLTRRIERIEGFGENRNDIHYLAK
ncbi:ATPase, T2SS/T4P/T4SS family [Gammaproteobacteria bacterium]|nr:ATPase, T2SS/T4P/T4SS family [Gammaproteobacteria bacterium]